MMTLKRLLHSFLIVILFCSAGLHAIRLETRHKPQGKLKISLDFDLATRAANDNASARTRRWIFSTYLVFKDSTTSITDGQLKQLAVDAWEKMQKDHDQYTTATSQTQRLDSLPNVMTVMAFDNQIILASSQRGASGFLDEFEGNPVSNALAICSNYWYEAHSDDLNLRDKWHRNQAKCGEVSTFWLYYQLPNTRKISDLKPRARVTTVSRMGDAIKIMKPCGTGSEKEWGCNLFVTMGEQVDYIMEDVPGEPYDLNDLAGGIDRISHIGACTRNHWD